MKALQKVYLGVAVAAAAGRVANVAISNDDMSVNATGNYSFSFECGNSYHEDDKAQSSASSARAYASSTSLGDEGTANQTVYFYSNCLEGHSMMKIRAFSGARYESGSGRVMAGATLNSSLNSIQYSLSLSMSPSSDAVSPQGTAYVDFFANGITSVSLNTTIVGGETATKKVKFHAAGDSDILGWDSY